MKKKTFIIFGLVILITFFLYWAVSNYSYKFFSPSSTNVVSGVKVLSIENNDNSDGEDYDKDFEIIAKNLEIPWEIAFLPSGEVLVTERPGRLLIIGKDRIVIEIDGVEHRGEGGLLGMALHPDYISNNWIYLYLTSKEGNKIINRVERYKLQNHILSERKIIINDIPGANYHDGGRIEFGPDGYLYVSTGDAGDSAKAQDKNSFNGTILRVTDEGLIPVSNPFNSLVFSYGHRNVQGLTWDEQGNLWATEHGRSGFKSGFDELNKIEIGQNYGWPIIEGDETKDDMMTAVLHSGETDIWAPAGAEYIGGSIFFAGLRGEALYEAVIVNQKVLEIKMHFREELGRLRAVRLGPDGYLYITTSNRDGRGRVNEGDDKLIKINPNVFKIND